MKKILILVLILTLALIGCNPTQEATENTIVVDEEAIEAVEETSENTTENEEVIENETEETEEATENETEEATENETEEATENETEETEEETEDVEYVQVPIDPTILDDHRPVVTITFENDKVIKFIMVPETAPNHVNAFITLANEGYYDGLIFHRIIEGFMMQGGDPTGTGSGGPGYTLDDEFYQVEDTTITFLPHYRGVVSMAKTGAPNSAGSQFFIMHQDYHSLNGSYSAFGYVIEGMDVVDEFVLVEKDSRDKPDQDVTMKSVTVELNGYEVKEVVKNIVE